MFDIGWSSELSSGSSAEALRDPVRERKKGLVTVDQEHRGWTLKTWVQICERLLTNPAASGPQLIMCKMGTVVATLKRH